MSIEHTSNIQSSGAVSTSVRSAMTKERLKTNDVTVAEALEMFSCPPGETHKVQIIRPPAAFSVKAYATVLTLPIGPAYIAAIMEKAGYDVDLVDAIGEDIRRTALSECGQYLSRGLSTDGVVARLVFRIN